MMNQEDSKIRSVQAITKVVEIRFLDVNGIEAPQIFRISAAAVEDAEWHAIGSKPPRESGDLSWFSKTHSSADAAIAEVFGSILQEQRLEEHTVTIDVGGSD